MSISKGSFRTLFITAIASYFFVGIWGWAEEVGNKPMHWSGTKTKWDRKKNQVELTGNATVNQPGETLKADYILLDLDKRTVHAKGRCVYTASETLIHSEELHFNLDTGAGSIVSGRVTNGSFLLSGQRINRLSETRYATHDAEYTTCHDCPGAWALQSGDVDLEIEGYATMSDVKFKIKDTPVIWSPFLVLPIKSKRQSGLLFPRFGSSTLHGFRFVQPVFWAVNRSVDMTFGLGSYSERGKRGEWEGRYALTERSVGQANFYFQADKKTDAPTKNRWGLNLAQVQELPFGVEEKLKLLETTDSFYPIHFSEDLPGRGEPVLTSNLNFSRSGNWVSSYVEGQRYRNLLNFDNPNQFDSKTVQLLPRSVITTNSQSVFSDFTRAELALGVSRFSRTATFFDPDIDGSFNGVFRPGKDPIRESTRVSARPSLYATLRPFDVISIVPKAEYRSYLYTFGNNIPSLSRGYLLFQTEASFQLERIYDQLDDPAVPKIKHLIRPFVRYSRIPYIDEPTHPFLTQIRSRNGYNFDNDDFVPVSNSASLINYFDPLGHSISYGATTQIIRRRSPLNVDFAAFQRSVELTGGQTFNILELKKPKGEQVPLSRVFSSLTFEFDHFTSGTQYYYYPLLDRLLPNVSESDRSPHEVSTNAKYVFEKSLHQDILSFERSVGVSYAYSKLLSKTNSASGNVVYSVSDYMMPAASISYDFLSRRFLGAGSTLTFQSPSKCWRLILSGSRTIDQGLKFDFVFNINLTGEGFSSLTDTAQKQSG